MSAGGTVAATAISDKEPAESATASRTVDGRIHVMHVAILVADGFTDSGLSVALDVLGTANVIARRAQRPPPFRMSIVGAARRVRAASGMSVAQTAPLATAASADLLLVPGYWVESTAEMDQLLRHADVGKLVRAISSAQQRGAVLASSCTGAFLLGEAGILDGHTVTTAWWLGQHLQQRCPRARVEVDRTLLVGRQLVTAGAAFAQADLSLHLVARVCGPTVARKVARVLLLDTHASQAAFMAVQQLSVNDDTVRRAEAWARRRLREPFSVEDMARAAGTSSRTLARRLAAAVGTTPIGFVQRLRVEQATHLLHTTALSIEQVSARVGYGDANALRRVMRTHMDVSPRELRVRKVNPAGGARAPRAVHTR
jgi:transcriptional regulator GlxA family with amidase domain